jgi:hypothetical protein
MVTSLMFETDKAVNLAGRSDGSRIQLQKNGKILQEGCLKVPQDVKNQQIEQH